MPRGKVVKVLTPVVRPFCDRQVRGLQDCANREGGIRGSPLHPVPPSPSSLTCGPHPSAPLRSPRNGCSLPQWRPLRPGTHCLGARRRRAPPLRRARCAPPIRPLPGEAQGPRYCRQVKSIQEQIHPTRQPKLLISCEMKLLSRVRLSVTPWTVAY